MKRSRMLLLTLAFQWIATVIYAQNVGIGETNPQAKLHIRSNLETIRLQGNASFISFFDDIGDYKGYLWQKNGTGMELGTTDGGLLPVFISPGNIPEITVRQGFTGLGNSDPAYRLDVSGRMRIRATDAALTAGIWFNNSTNTTTPAFIGMREDNTIGIYSSLYGWALTMNTDNAEVRMEGNLTANTFRFTAPREYYYSLSAVDFSAANSSEEVRKEFVTEGAYMNSTSATGLRAPIHLPDRAVITAMRAYAYDNSVMDFNITLWRRTFSNGDLLPMATVTTAGTPGHVNLTTGTFDQPVIDNLVYNYFISVAPTGALWSGSQNYIRGIFIRYVVMEAQ